MKAAVLYELGQPLIVEQEIKIPVLRRGQVLVKLAYSGVCHSQLMEVRGKRGEDRYLPHMLGHEGSGEVVEVGPDVSEVKVGDKVVLGWIKGRGIDAGGTTYQLGKKTINAGPVTTFSDYSIVSENRCYKLPMDMPLDVAVLFGCAIPTGAGLVLNQLQPHEGADVAIVGLGGIGLSALMACRLLTLNKIIVLDVSDEKLELAKSFGATHGINVTDGNAKAKLMDLTDGQGVDYSIEAAGRVDTIELAFEVAKQKTGRCVFASHPKHGDKIKLDPFELLCGKRIEGTDGGQCVLERDIPKYMQAYKDGLFPLESLCSEAYSLDDINVAMDDLERNKLNRALVKVS